MEKVAPAGALWDALHLSCPTPRPVPSHPAEPQQRLRLSHQAVPHGSLVHAPGDVLVEVAVTAALLAIRPLWAGVDVRGEVELPAAPATSRVHHTHSLPHSEVNSVHDI